MSEIKQYHIDSFEKLCNVVNMENATRLAIDLGQWLMCYAATIDNIRTEYPKETKGKRNTKIAKGSFTWIDDGKNDILGSRVEIPDTGEIMEVRYDEKPHSEQTVQVSDTTKA